MIYYYLIGVFLSFFNCNTKDTNKPRPTLLIIPLTIRYLYCLLYNTFLEYNSYTTFAFFPFVDYPPMHLENYNAERVPISVLLLLYLTAIWRSVSYFLLWYKHQWHTRRALARKIDIFARENNIMSSHVKITSCCLLVLRCVVVWSKHHRSLIGNLRLPS